MGKVEENQQQKQQKLLETAFNLFTSKGINETTIQDIVSHAGIAKGTFYLYFKDKYDLIEKLRRRKTVKLFEDAVNFSHQAHYDNFTQQFIIIIEYIVDELTNNQALLKFIYKNLSMGLVNMQIDTANGESFPNAVYKMFEQRVLEEQLPIENPKATFFMIAELVGATCYNSILFGIPIPIEQFKPLLIVAIRNLLTGSNSN